MFADQAIVQHQGTMLQLSQSGLITSEMCSDGRGDLPRVHSTPGIISNNPCGPDEEQAVLRQWTGRWMDTPK